MSRMLSLFYLERNLIIKMVLYSVLQVVLKFNRKFNDPKRNKGRNMNIQCKNCGIKGNSIDKCYKLIGYPKDYKPRSEFSNQNNTSKLFSANVSSSTSSDPCNSGVILLVVFLIDSILPMNNTPSFSV